MELAVGIFVVAMVALYIWSHVTAGHRIGKKLQPFVDELFGVSPKPPQKPKD